MSHIDCRREGAIGLVVLNRPDKLNAFAGTMREDILKALEDLERDKSVRVVIVTGAGRGFCGGGDVRYMKELRERNDVADFSRILDAANACVRKLQAYPKPTIAAVNGVAAGGGANLALCCDIRLGSTECSFTQSFVKIGLGPDWGGSFLLPQIVGRDRAKELLLTGRLVKADEALRLGLVHELHEPDALMDAVRALASRLAQASPHAVAAIKGATRAQGLDHALEYERSAQWRCFLTDEAYEAFGRFAAKAEKK
ncbi:MAG: enoyl-CoA hydratase/isomerase family protein [Planctomycetes bacterium]|nr:enoyl-CoA hydratase/isomerase family protein [Planctomycetota bacterium]